MPVRRWNSRACHSMAAARPISSSTSGRSPDAMRRTEWMMRSIAWAIAWVFSRHRRGVVGAVPLGKRADVELEAGERLAQLVVDLARDVDAFLLAHRLQVCRERPQVLLRGAQPLLREGALRELGVEHPVHVVQAHEDRELRAQHLGARGSSRWSHRPAR